MAGRILIVVGLTLAALGVLVSWAPGGLGWIGRLPGDIRVDRPGLRLYLPLTTSLLLSVLLSALLYLVSRLR